MTSDRTLITVATFNEIDNLPRLVERLREVLPQADILVIDDNSPDGTGEWARERSASDGKLQALVRSGKLGLGTATLAGFQRAVDEGYDLVVNLDADFSHPPERVPDLVEVVVQGRADVAIGSRYIAGGGTQHWPWWRRFISRSLNLYARVMLRLPIRDCSGSFRCYRVSLLGELDFSRIRSRGYAYQEEILWHLARADAVFEEVPFVFVDRRFGSSKISIREAWEAWATITRLGWSTWVGKGRRVR